MGDWEVDPDAVVATVDFSVREAQLAREVLRDYAAGYTTNESAARLRIQPTLAWQLLARMQSAIRQTRIEDQRHDMVTKSLLAEQTLMQIMNSRYVRVSAAGHVVMRPTGRTYVDDEGQVRNELEEVEDPTPRIQAAAALSLVISRHSKLVGADAPQQVAIMPSTTTGRTIEDDLAALAAELGLNDRADAD